MHKYQPETIAYVEELQSKVMFGKCAGKITELSKLHKNRMISKLAITQQIVDLSRIIGNAFPKLDVRSIIMKKIESRSVKEEIEVIHFDRKWLDDYEISTKCSKFVSKFTEITTRVFSNIDEKHVIRWFQPEFPYNRVLINNSSHQIIATAGRNTKEKSGLFFDIKDLFSKYTSMTFSAILSEIIENCEDKELIYSIHPEYHQISFDVFVKGTFHLDMHLNLFKDSDGEHSKPFASKIRKHVIFGNPGDGKTIALHQYCDQLCDDILDGKQVLIPIYMKANQLARSVNSCYEYLQAIEEDNPRSLLGAEMGLEELFDYDNLLQTISDSIRGFNQRIFSDFYHSIDFIDECIFLIDAWDECDEYELNMLHQFFYDPRLTKLSASSYVITSRHSHTDSLSETLNLHGWGYTYSQIDHSDKELQDIMPKRLANAWGINSDRMELDFVNVIDNYKEVLTHPLFVGLFCLMLHSNILSESVKQTRTTKNESRQISIGKYTLAHVEFLNKVIEIGLEVNIKDRRTITVESMENIRNVFYFIAGLYEFNRMRSLDEILNTIEDNFSLKLNEQEQNIIRNNLGLLFVGKNNLEWTHKTLREVACAKLMNTNKLFVSLIKSRRTTGLKYRREGFGECVTLGLVYYKNQCNNFGTLKNFTSLLSEWGGGIATSMIQGLELKREPIFNRVIKDKRNGEFSFDFKTKQQILVEIAHEYIGSIRDSSSFPYSKFALPLWALRGLDSRSLTDIFSNLQHLPLNTQDGRHSRYFKTFPDMKLKDFLQLRINDQGWNRTNDYERWLGYYQDVIIDWFMDSVRFKRIKDINFIKCWENDIMTYAQQSVMRIKHGKTITENRGRDNLGDVTVYNRIQRITEWEFYFGNYLPDKVYELELPEEIIDCLCKIIYNKSYNESLEFIEQMKLEKESKKLTPEWDTFLNASSYFGLEGVWLIDTKRGLVSTNLFKLGVQYMVFAFCELEYSLINVTRSRGKNHPSKNRISNLFNKLKFDESKFKHYKTMLSLMAFRKGNRFRYKEIKSISWEQVSEALEV